MAVIIEDDAYAVLVDYHRQIASAIARIKEKIAPSKSE